MEGIDNKRRGGGKWRRKDRGEKEKRSIEGNLRKRWREEEMIRGKRERENSEERGRKRWREEGKQYIRREEKERENSEGN